MNEGCRDQKIRGTHTEWSELAQPERRHHPRKYPIENHRKPEEWSDTKHAAQVKTQQRSSVHLVSCFHRVAERDRARQEKQLHPKIPARENVTPWERPHTRRHMTYENSHERKASHRVDVGEVLGARAVLRSEPAADTLVGMSFIRVWAQGSLDDSAPPLLSASRFVRNQAKPQT